MYLYIKFQLKCFFTLSWNIWVKDIFSFQKLKISFREILLQRKPPHALLVLLSLLRNKKEVICKNVKPLLQRIVRINTWRSNQYTEAVVQMFFRISQISQENTCVGVLFGNVAGLKACNFVKKRLQHRSFPVKFAEFLRTLLGAAYEFCSGGCAVSVSKYIIISNQCIKVNVWSIVWCCIHSKIMPE